MQKIVFSLMLLFSTFAFAKNYTLDVCIADQSKGLWANFDSGNDVIFEIDFKNGNVAKYYADDNVFSECWEDEAKKFTGKYAACGSNDAPVVEVDGGNDVIFQLKFVTRNGALNLDSFNKLYIDDNPATICL